MTTLATVSTAVTKALDGLDNRQGDLEDKFERVVEATTEIRRAVTAGIQHRAGGAGEHLPGRVFGSDTQAKGFADLCLKVGRGETKDLDGQTDATGAFLIPEEYKSEILRIVERVGQLIAIVRRVPIGLGPTHWPMAGQGPTVYWLTSGAPIPESTPETKGVDMTAERLAALVPVDNLLLNEPLSPAVGEWLGMEFAYAITKEIERVMAVGTGIPGDGKVTGILNSDNVTIVNMASGKTAFTDLTWDHLVDLEANIVDMALGDAMYVLSRSVLGIIKKLKDSGGLPIWHAPAGPEPATINGYPYQLSNAFPVAGDSAAATPFLVFGNLREGVLMGEYGTGLAIDRSEHFKFNKAQTCFRALTAVTAQVVPGGVSGKNPIAVLKTAAS